MIATQRTRALDLLKARGMLRLRDFIAEGIEPETLARLVREGQVIRPARGLYQLPDTQIEAAYMLAEAAVLVPKGIVCIRQRKCTPDQLWQYAKKARVWTVMRPYVESVVSDAA